MNVLIIGSGGREHAIGWKLKQSPKVSKIYFAPGNGGTSEIGENVPLDIKNNISVVKFSKKNAIDLVIVTPDDQLANGMVDELIKAGIHAFGPTKKASKIESSKKFAKQLMEEEHIPTALFKLFSNFIKAKQYVIKQKIPIVIKANGLALGKGVFVCKTMSEALDVLKKIMIDNIFGSAGKTVVIEEFLQGYEVSIHVLCDGKTTVIFPASKDHKAIYERNKGPNTGGMGTIAPAPKITNQLFNDIEKKVITPLLKGLRKRNIIFKGCLFPGLMITKDGPKVLEFNARFGDPETQSYMRLLRSDLCDIFMSCINGSLSKQKIRWQKKSSCCIMMASEGYPGTYVKGKKINSVNKAQEIEDIVIFHSGTTYVDGNLVTNGGRVLGISATGNTLDQTLKKAYKAVKRIRFDGMQFRKDIGK